MLWNFGHGCEWGLFRIVFYGSPWHRNDTIRRVLRHSFNGEMFTRSPVVYLSMHRVHMKQCKQTNLPSLILVFETTKIDKTVPNFMFWMTLVKRTTWFFLFQDRGRQNRMTAGEWRWLRCSGKKFDWLIWSCDVAPCDLNYEWITEKYGSAVKLTILLGMWMVQTAENLTWKVFTD